MTLAPDLLNKSCVPWHPRPGQVWCSAGEQSPRRGGDYLASKNIFLILSLKKQEQCTSIFSLFELFQIFEQ